MTTGAVIGSIDVAQIVLYLFWIFFAGLVFYLHRENKREGYPLENDRSWRVRVEGFPSMPKPKTFTLRDGSTVSVPAERKSTQMLRAESRGNFLGAPLDPTGNAMLEGVGPGSYADRADVADRTLDDQVRIVPLRAAPGYDIEIEDIDPRGLKVIGADGAVGGVVRDLWVDRSEAIFRYLEIEVANAPRGPYVLLPVNFARIGKRGVQVKSILGGQFAGVPRTRNPDQVTFLEEEKITAYYGAGTLYATPARREPLL